MTEQPQESRNVAPGQPHDRIFSETVLYVIGLAFALIEDGARVDDMLVDVGTADQFLDQELRPELLERACSAAGIELTLRLQPGYDHSYYFISTFMADHLRWHAERLNA